MAHQTRIAVPIIRAPPSPDKQVRAACAAGADLIELRVDCIGDISAVANLLRQPHRLPFILTIRTRAEGGAWAGDEGERIALLEQLGALRPGYADVEFAAWARSAELRRVVGAICAPPVSRAKSLRRRDDRPANRLILSHHDMHGTPADLERATAALFDPPADVIKLVFTARDATDAWRVLEFLHRHGPQRRMIALAMGSAGLLTRVLAPKFGGFLTFAALEAGAESAPGQPTVPELRNVYRWREIGPPTAVFGVVGWPVAHSLSPAIHNAAMASARIDGVYVPMPVAPTYDDLATFLNYLTAHPKLDVRGLSITIPHKAHALRWLDECRFRVSDIARQAGAVNTLTRSGPATWTGDNTDVVGVIAALRRAGALDAIGGTAAAVLGAGGAARAAILALRQQNCRITIYNRTSARAQALAQELHCESKSWDERCAADAQLIINCTSLGMSPDADGSPLTAQALRPGQVVLDAVYTPAQTRLLREARAAGCRVISGVELFIGQAAEQFVLWHAQPAPTPAMRRALRSPTAGA